jgi:GNAT superfamily N-acetyltransferase
MTHTLIVRPAKPNEKHFLEKLQRRASLIWDDYRAALLENPDAIELPNEEITAGNVQVCERNGTVIGFSVVLPRKDADAELDGLFVEPTVWRAGVGRRLIQAARITAIQRGAGTLHVIANPQAVAFYEACGFTGNGIVETRFGPAIRMTYLLKPEI